jgi:hypothetical protein
MATVVSICNLALSNIGKENINDLTEKSAEARACNQFYAQTRDVLLQSFPWAMAGKTVALGALDNDKPGVWRHSYARPADCLQIRWIRSGYLADASAPLDAPTPDLDEAGREMQYPYALEGDRLYCDISPALLRYTSRLTDPTKYSPLFLETLSWHLAVRLAMPLTRDPKIRADAMALAQSTQAAAEQAEANQIRHTSADFVSELIAVRAHG